jgi:hypothetical protein
MIVVAQCSIRGEPVIISLPFGVRCLSLPFTPSGHRDVRSPAGEFSVTNETDVTVEAFSRSALFRSMEASRPSREALFVCVCQTGGEIPTILDALCDQAGPVGIEPRSSGRAGARGSRALRSWTVAEAVPIAASPGLRFVWHGCNSWAKFFWMGITLVDESSIVIDCVYLFKTLSEEPK